MPFQRPHDPNREELVAYVVARSSGRGATLTRTKLMKLLYLIDVDRAVSRLRPLASDAWTFFHYGPYAHDLAADIQRLESTGQLVTTVGSKGDKNWTLYRGTRNPVDVEGWRDSTRITIDQIVDRWAGEDLNLLLDHVYFHTAPMESARRGEPLDLSLAAGQPRLRPQPLTPPEVPAELKDRAAEWIKSRRGRYRSVPTADLQSDDDYLAAMAATGDLPPDPAEQAMTHSGRLHVLDPD